jgi:hypothetical protein
MAGGDHYPYHIPSACPAKRFGSQLLYFTLKMWQIGEVDVIRSISRWDLYNSKSNSAGLKFYKNGNW